MKKIIWLIPLLILMGCVSQQRVSDLEAKIEQLSKQKASSTMLLAEQAGARKFWWRNALSGGGDGLDGIPAANLVNGDAAFVMVQDGVTMTAYLYVYNNTDITAENLPLIVAPNDGGGRWYLVNFNVAILTSNSADGTHYLDMSNTATLDVGSRADGRCWYAKDNNRIECYDGTNVQYWTATGNE